MFETERVVSPTRYSHLIDKCGKCRSTRGHNNSQYFTCYDCGVETHPETLTQADYNAPEQCDGCGKGIHNGAFAARFRKVTDGPFLVGDCCGDRSTGFFKAEYDPHGGNPAWNRY